VERFWRALPARERTRLLASADAWCLPIPLLRDYLEGLVAAAESRRAEASRREARRALADYGRCLESEEEKARRAVASGLVEMKGILERIWPCAQLADLGRRVVVALRREVSPGIANLLEQLTQTLATLALARGECAEVEAILTEIDQAPAEADEERLAALTRRIVDCEEWLLLVDLALANRALDSALPRLLRRDPERMLDRLRLLLTSSAGPNALPAMARLVRAAGEPVLGALETHLLEPRRQRVATAIKLLSAAAPERLTAALARAFSSWDWSLQDLAVTELARRGFHEIGRRRFERPADPSVQSQLRATQSVDDNAGAARFQDLGDAVGDLRGQLLLHLETTRITVHDPRELADADDFVGWQVAHVHPADDGRHMVLTVRLERDIA